MKSNNNNKNKNKNLNNKNLNNKNNNNTNNSNNNTNNSNNNTNTNTNTNTNNNNIKYKPFNLKNIKFNLTTFLNNLGTNKLFIGIMMIFMNLGSRFIEIKLTKGQEIFFKNAARELLIFTIAFMGSRDIFIALIITSVFIILSNFIFNENSKYNILSKKYKNIIDAIDTDNDGEISQEELDKAQEILKKAKNKDNLNNKIEALNKL